MVFDKYNYSLLGLVQLGRRRLSAHHASPAVLRSCWAITFPFLRLLKPSGVVLGPEQLFAWFNELVVQLFSTVLVSDCFVKSLCSPAVPPGPWWPAHCALLHQRALLLLFTEQTYLHQVWNWTVLLLQVVHLNKQVNSQTCIAKPLLSVNGSRGRWGLCTAEDFCTLRTKHPTICIC